jgi:hypothetical protein
VLYYIWYDSDFYVVIILIGVGIEDLSKNKDHVAEVEQVGKGVDEGRTHE